MNETIARPPAQEVTVEGPHTHVVKFPSSTGNQGSTWPAWYFNENYVIVDLRLFLPRSKDEEFPLKLQFQEEALRKIGMPEETIQAAAASTPIQGFVFSPIAKPRAT